jgi:organic hydroperoxide reductase OsmC/OhrA
MSTYGCTVRWHREAEADFARGRYSRAHQWAFDGGAVVPGSSSVLSVPLPWSDPAAVDPEEAFVAAVSSCHMLWFLALAAKRGFVVDGYEDAAEGVMETIAPAREAITQVLLRPEVVFAATRLPTDEEVEALHHAAHEHCYIANSIRSEVRVQGRWRAATAAT